MMTRSIRSIVFSHFFALFAVFFILSGMMVYFLIEDGLMNFFVGDHTRAVSFLAQNIQSNLENNLRALDHLATMEGLQPYEATKAAALVQQFLKFENAYSTINIYKANGDRVLYAKRPMTEEAYYTDKANFYQKWDRNFVRTAEQVIRTGKPMPTNVYEREAGVQYQTYIVPILDRQSKNGVWGILSGRIYYRFNDPNSFLHGLKLGEDNFVLLSDRVGHLLARDGAMDHLSGPEVTSLVAPEVQQSSEYFYSNPGEAPRSQVRVADFTFGEKYSKYLTFSTPIQELNLNLILGANLKSVESRKLTVLKTLFVGLIFGLLFAFFASWLMGNVLSKPFRILAEGIRNLNEGKFSQPIRYTKGNEIGEMCTMVNDVSKKVEKGQLLGSLWSRRA